MQTFEPLGIVYGVEPSGQGPYVQPGGALQTLVGPALALVTGGFMQLPSLSKVVPLGHFCPGGKSDTRTLTVAGVTQLTTPDDAFVNVCVPAGQSCCTS